MKRKSKIKKLSFATGGNTVNPFFPNVKRSAMNKKTDAKSNIQTMFFSGSMVTK
jgi:hypothetical protein